MEYAEQYIALCLGGAGSASAPAPGIVLDGTAPFTLDMMVRGIPVESAASVLHQEGALDVRLTAKGFPSGARGLASFPLQATAKRFNRASGTTCASPTSRERCACSSTARSIALCRSRAREARARSRSSWERASREGFVNCGCSTARSAGWKCRICC